MNIQECYNSMGADYEGMLNRVGRERLVARFASKFPTDTSYSELISAIQKEDWSEAFRAAHTLKGVTSNLGFTRLHEVTHKLTESLRPGKKPEDMSLVDEVTEAYNVVISALEQLDQ
jgi:HPt (histidine-containing phosphotransfer) domain-containing protein